VPGTARQLLLLPAKPEPGFIQSDDPTHEVVTGAASQWFVSCYAVSCAAATDRGQARFCGRVHRWPTTTQHRSRFNLPRR